MSGPQPPHMKKLEEAIREALIAEEWPGVPVGMMVLISFADIDDDGDDTSGHGILYPTGDLPWYQVIGLLRCASIAQEAKYQEL